MWKSFFANVRKVINRRYILIDFLGTFPLFAAQSAGSYRAKSKLAMNAINNIFPLLLDLTESTSAAKRIDVCSTQVLLTRNVTIKKNSEILKNLCNKYGTEKPAPLYALYAHILSEHDRVTNIFEVGIGTHHTDVVSTMGAKGMPGASLRAFRDFCPNATVYGGDIDSRVLFDEERIHTFHIDQTDFSVFESVITSLGLEFDLFIDDGLHAPDANLATLIVALKVTKPGGWIVIEDIGESALEFWQLVSNLMPSNLDIRIFRSTERGLIFCVNKII